MTFINAINSWHSSKEKALGVIRARASSVAIMGFAMEVGSL